MMITTQNKTRLQEIHKRMQELDEAFYNINENYRCSKLADPIREESCTLKDEAELLVGIPPIDYSKPLPDIKNPNAVQILPSTNAPVESWGVTIPFKELDTKLKEFGLQFEGEFLMPINAPHLVRYAIFRRFVEIKDNKILANY